MNPELSVIVVVGDRRDRVGDCLRSLFAQGLGGRLEVLLFDLSSAEPVPESHHPAVRRFRRPCETLFAEARAEGVCEALAPVVAFLEEHVVALPGWGEALIAAHAADGGSWTGVGPAVRNANPRVGRSAIAGLIGEGYAYEPVVPGATAVLPGHNSSYKTEVLRGYGAGLRRLLTSDSVLVERLLRDGHRLAMEPAARIEHLNETTLRSRGYGMFLWYRLHGSVRAEEFRWTPAHRLFYVAATPFMPFYFLAHFLPFLARTRPQYLPLFLRNLPWVLACSLAGACGQALGLLRGRRGAEARFTRYELTADRPR